MTLIRKTNIATTAVAIAMSLMMTGAGTAMAGGHSVKYMGLGQLVDCIDSPCLKQDYPDYRSRDERRRDFERFFRRNDMLEHGIPLMPKERMLHEERLNDFMHNLKLI